MATITYTETGNTYATHADYIAHLKTLDAAFEAGIKALGFKRRNNLRVRGDVRVNRLGFEDGYLIRARFTPEATEPDFTAYANTVAETEAALADLAALISHS